MRTTFPDYINMWGAPVDTVTFKDGTTFYYCSALTGTASSLTEPKFKIMRKMANAYGDYTFAHAFTTIGGKIVGGYNYELPVVDLATIQSYTYSL